jgi:diguanylate cyclase (GGDEF)-like protein
MSDTLATLDDLLARGEAARQAGDVTAGLAMAEQACLLAAEADAPRRLKAGLLRMQFLYRAGALPEVVASGQQLLPALREGESVDDLLDALRMMTLAACETANYVTALAAGQELHQQAMTLADKGRHSLALNALACVFERMGDPWQGERLMNEALTLAREFGRRYEIFVGLNNLTALLIGRFHLLRDAVSADDARVPLTLALPLSEEAFKLGGEMGDPFPLVFVTGNLGEVLLHLGRFDEAECHLREAIALAHRHGYQAQDWRIKCSIGELQLAQGDAAAAWATLSEALVLSAGSDPRSTQMRLHHTLSQAARRLDRPADALHHLDAYLRLERTRSVMQLHAQSQLFITRVEAEQVRLDAQRQRARASELEADSRRDQLTGVGNRREVEHRLPGLLADAKANAQKLAMVMIDIDHFKQVNDRHGHGAGDRVLVALGRLLREATRGQDVVARIGGEEFLLVLPHSGADEAREVCERLRRRVEQHPWGAIAPGLRLTLSLGVACAPPYDAADLASRADRALYRAKDAGRDRLVFD